jgi:hypothetical protein
MRPDGHQADVRLSEGIGLSQCGHVVPEQKNNAAKAAFS